MSHFTDLETVITITRALRNFIPDEYLNSFPQDRAPFHPVYTFAPRTAEEERLLGTRPVQMLDQHGDPMPHNCIAVDLDTYRFIARRTHKTPWLPSVRQWDPGFKENLDRVVHSYFLYDMEPQLVLDI